MSASFETLEAFPPSRLPLTDALLSQSLAFCAHPRYRDQQFFGSV